MSGWSFDFILWELPYVTGIQMLHAESVYNDNAVEYVDTREVAPAAGLAGQFAKMRQEKMGD